MLKWIVTTLVALSFSNVANAEPSYVGSKGCKKCHIKQHKSWEKTKMAKSFEHLKANVAADAKKKAGLDPAKDYTTDAKCLKCHTTGYGKPGGYGSGANNAELMGTGCEACHGPGSEYLKDGRMTNKNKEFKTADLKQYGFLGKPEAAVCTACHNKESPFFKEFNFEKSVKEGTHEHIKLKNAH